MRGHAISCKWIVQTSEQFIFGDRVMPDCAMPKPALPITESGRIKLEVFIHGEWQVIHSLGPECGPWNKRLLRLEVQMMHWKEMDYFDGAALRIVGA